MFLKAALLSLLTAFLSSGSPVSPNYGLVSAKLENRAEYKCDPHNMPVNIFRTDCPKKNRLDKNGHCKDAISPIFQDNPQDPRGCGAYCEESLRQLYGQEVPFDNAVCIDGSDCILSEGKTVTVTRSWEISVSFSGNGGLGLLDENETNMEMEPVEPSTLQLRDDNSSRGKFTAVFHVGASFSFSKSVAHSVTIALKEPINETHCGYWTFVPRLLESCGTYSEAEHEQRRTGFYNEYIKDTCNKDKIKSYRNWCNKAPSKLKDDRADGVTIFVLVDCETNKLKPMKEQHPVYRYPGVSTGPLEDIRTRPDEVGDRPLKDKEPEGKPKCIKIGDNRLHRCRQ